jgi:hypothetical protein
MSLIEKIDAMKVKAQRLIVNPPHDSLDEIANDISEGYITACNEIRDYILSEQPKEPCEYCKNLRNNKNIIENDVFITGGNVLFANGESGYQRARINFCPMCGRPLKAD